MTLCSRVTALIRVASSFNSTEKVANRLVIRLIPMKTHPRTAHPSDPRELPEHVMLHCSPGVTYADVAGIDKVKGDIQVAMDMLLGAPAFRAMGARPFRVRTPPRCMHSPSES